MRGFHFVYRINDIETNRLIYIGQTGDIFDRASGHEHMNEDRKISFVEVGNKRNGLRIEAVLLSVFDPLENINIPKENPLMPEKYSMSDVTDWIDLDTFEFKSGNPRKDRGNNDFSIDIESGEEWDDEVHTT